MPSLSLIIPAYNEEALLPATLEQAKVALEGCGVPGEIIVVDNASTDATAQIAHAAGARVVFEAHNQIARARNSGARASTADWLVFLDADSWLPSPLLAATVDALASGKVVGGGSTLRFDQPNGAIAALCLRLWTALSTFGSIAAGSYFFARRDAFEAVGGFPESAYAGEDVYLSRQLKRWGRRQAMTFTLLTGDPIVTSSRKFEWHSPAKVAAIYLSLALLPFLTRSRRFCRFWYHRG